MLTELARKSESGGVTWLVEDPYVATGDFMVGSAGVAHFLLHLVKGPDDFSAPLLIGTNT